MIGWRELGTLAELGPVPYLFGNGRPQARARRDGVSGREPLPARRRGDAHQIQTSRLLGLVLDAAT
jgi:hypothetical protein